MAAQQESAQCSWQRYKLSVCQFPPTGRSRLWSEHAETGMLAATQNVFGFIPQGLTKHISKEFMVGSANRLNYEVISFSQATL